MQPDFDTCFPLRRGRVHEAFGHGKAAFAAMTMATCAAAVEDKSAQNALWIGERWRKDRLNPIGLLEFMNPSNLLLAETKSQKESLGVAEEALRSGVLASVIVETTQPITLTEGRRLQLAAREGHSVGLCLIPEGMGSNAAETRWQVQPLFDRDRTHSSLMGWSLVKNKSGILGRWRVQWLTETRQVELVSDTSSAMRASG